MAEENQVTAEENQITTKDPRKVEQGAESNCIKREVENEVTANKMAEENQIQQVATKDPKKVAQGKKLAESNHIKEKQRRAK